MNWDDLVAFRAVAEECSFTRAAAKLYIAQPTLSQRVRRLEKSLGAQLLHRTTRSVELSPAGSALLRWVVHTDQRWREIRYEIDGLADENVAAAGLVRSLLRVGVARLWPGRLVERLREEQPATQWSLMATSSPADLVHRLWSGEIHFALWSQLAGVRSREVTDIRTATVARWPLSVQLAADHPLAARPVVEPIELTEVPWVVHPDHDLGQETVRTIRGIGGFEPRIAGVAHDPSEVRALLLGHRAAAFCEPHMGLGVPGGEGIVRRPLRGAPSCAVRLTWRPRTVPDEAAQVVLQVARALCGEGGEVTQRHKRVRGLRHDRSHAMVVDRRDARIA